MPKSVVTLCAALALTACGTSSAGDSATDTAASSPPSGASGQPSSSRANESRPSSRLSAEASTPSSRVPPTRGDSHIIGFGSEYRFTSGLVVTVSSPDVFEPSDSAYPRSERAAAFGIKIFNDSDQPYRLSNFSVEAVVAGEKTKQVQDATRGYNGIPDADRDLAAGDTAQMTLAFAVRAEPARMRLILHPDASNSLKAVFTGSV